MNHRRDPVTEVDVASSRIPEILQVHRDEVLDLWISEQLGRLRRDRLKEGELREECSEFLRLLTQAAQTADLADVNAQAWTPVREMLTRLSRTRGRAGFSPTETALFVFSLKRPLFAVYRRTLPVADQVEAITVTTELIDRLGLLTVEAHQKAREEIISRQQEEMLELSTPVVNLWDGILALPLIGTLDSARTQTVMESLLQRIVETSAEMAIIDITGVPTVDTLTAQHLLKTVTATRLMGADCVISGIRPQIAQTIVHLGVDLTGVATQATLSGAFRYALQRTGWKLGRRAPVANGKG